MPKLKQANDNPRPIAIGTLKYFVGGKTAVGLRFRLLEYARTNWFLDFSYDLNDGKISYTDNPRVRKTFGALEKVLLE